MLKGKKLVVQLHSQTAVHGARFIWILDFIAINSLSDESTSIRRHKSGSSSSVPDFSRKLLSFSSRKPSKGRSKIYNSHKT